MVRAKNNYGDGLNSTTVTGYTASVPSQPIVPTLAIDGTFVSLNWTAPLSNNLPIIAYKLVIADINDDYTET
jgi:hypothetical protein